MAPMAPMPTRLIDYINMAPMRPCLPKACLNRIAPRDISGLDSTQ